MATWKEMGSYINGLQRWGVDDTTYNLTPLNGFNQVIDADHGIGTQAARVPINGFLPDLVIFGTSAAHAAVANSVAETSIVGVVPSTMSKTLAAGLLNAAGKTLVGRVVGRMGNTGTPNITINVKLGTTTILTTTAKATATITGSHGFALDFTITTLTTGATGTVDGGGFFVYNVDGVTGTAIDCPAVSGAAVTLDLTAAQAVDITATWGTQSSSNTITGLSTLLLLRG